MNASAAEILRVARRLARLSVVRWRNRVAARTQKRRGPGRAAVARKSGSGGWWTLVFGALMVLQAFFLSVQATEVFARGVERDARAAGETKPGAEEEEWAREMERVLPGRSDLRNPFLATWPAPEREDRFLLAMAALLTMLFVSIVFLHLASGERDLGQVGWDMEWLFTFPVPTQGLFLAKLGQYALTDAMTWFTFFPLLTVVFWRSGHAAAGIPLALASTAAVAVLGAAVRLTLETWFQQRMSRARLRNAQAVATILSMVGMVGALGIAMRPPEALFALARQAPSALLWLPWASPLLTVSNVAALFIPLAWAAVSLLGVLGATTRMVREGLLAAGGGPYEGTRRATSVARPRRARPRRASGIVGKDLRLLLRDRTLFVQVAVIPLVMIALQLVMNPHFLRAGDADSAATLAFGVGAYSGLFGAFTVLEVERRSLWLLFTFPCDLMRVLRRKVILWVSLACLYVLGTLAFAWRPSWPPSFGSIARPLLALGGVAALGYVAAALAVLGTDPFADDVRRRIRRGAVWTYMLLGSTYGFALAAAPLWPVFVLLVLLVLLGWALWQKVGEQLPVLLDPVERPVRTLSLPDGLIAVLVFFALQVLCGAALRAAGAWPPIAAGIAYVFAGTLAVVTLCVLRKDTSGFREAVGTARRVSARALATGAAAGLAAASVALLWTQVVEAVTPLREMRDASVPLVEGPSAAGRVWLVVLLVVAAPVVEEWLFRGFVYGGMRRTTRALPAMLLTSALFAVVHPPVGAPAVFALGMATALVVERTRCLWAAMVTHGVYNAIVLLLGAA